MTGKKTRTQKITDSLKKKICVFKQVRLVCIKVCITVSLHEAVQRLKSELPNLLYGSRSMSASRIKKWSKQIRQGGADRLCAIKQRWDWRVTQFHWCQESYVCGVRAALVHWRCCIALRSGHNKSSPPFSYICPGSLFALFCIKSPGHFC